MGSKHIASIVATTALTPAPSALRPAVAICSRLRLSAGD